MRRRAVAIVLAAVLVATAGAQAQHAHDHGAAKPAPAAGARQPMRVTMEQIHGAPGGVPEGWRFWWPDGDVKKGKDVFAKLECYQCHEMPGEGFPAVTPDPTRKGPMLAGMGDRHPAEYFAESIVNPNAVILTGPGFTGPDGLSIMPDFRDSLTLAETADLVAYIRSLTGGAHAHHAHDDAAPAEREKTVGSYRIRLAYMAPDGAGGHDHDHGSGGHQHGAPAKKAGHVMVFVNDTATGEPVPYLPVTVTVRAAKAQPRVVKLTPMVGGKGFHYGADLTLPAATTAVTVSVGKPAMKVMASAASRFAQGAEAAFEWGK